MEGLVREEAFEEVGLLMERICEVKGQVKVGARRERANERGHK